MENSMLDCNRSGDKFLLITRILNNKFPDDKEVEKQLKQLEETRKNKASISRKKKLIQQGDKTTTVATQEQSSQLLQPNPVIINENLAPSLPQVFSTSSQPKKTKTTQSIKKERTHLQERFHHKEREEKLIRTDLH